MSLESGLATRALSKLSPDTRLRLPKGRPCTQSKFMYLSTYFIYSPRMVGLRERKAAETRLALVASLERHLATMDLDDITVDQLAADANVSRMTFFNYFPSKRDAVDMMMTIFVYRCEASIRQLDLRGAAAIEHVFELLGEALAKAPHGMRRLYAQFCSRPATRTLPVLTRAEREQLLPSGWDGRDELASLGRLFVRLAAEAKADGLPLVGSDYEISHFLGALLNGTAMVGHSSEDTDWRQLFRRHARRALGLLGAPGQKDPRAPRIPKRYRQTGGKR